MEMRRRLQRIASDSMERRRVVSVSGWCDVELVKANEAETVGVSSVTVLGSASELEPVSFGAGPSTAATLRSAYPGALSVAVADHSSGAVYVTTRCGRVDCNLADVQQSPPRYTTRQADQFDSSGSRHITCIRRV